MGKNAGAFPKFQLTVVAAFHELVFNDVPKQFPNLRFGFVETGAQWLPYVLMHLLRRPGFTDMTGPQLMRENHLYVACEVHEDLPYILQSSGEDSLVVGTDYSHADPHMELNAVRALRARKDVEPGIVEKILDDNARALYGF
jgi:predicted TIM-barrel fold metal-dependent hydrolase